jgi:hypothetical protein
MVGLVNYTPSVTDENGLFDPPRHRRAPIH